MACEVVRPGPTTRYRKPHSVCFTIHVLVSRNRVHDNCCAPRNSHTVRWSDTHVFNCPTIGMQSAYRQASAWPSSNTSHHQQPKYLGSHSSWVPLEPHCGLAANPARTSVPRGSLLKRQQNVVSAVAEVGSPFIASVFVSLV